MFTVRSEIDKYKEENIKYAQDILNVQVYINDHTELKRIESEKEKLTINIEKVAKTQCKYT